MILLHLDESTEHKMGIWECWRGSRRRDRKQYSGGESNEVDARQCLNDIKSKCVNLKAQIGKKVL